MSEKFVILLLKSFIALFGILVTINGIAQVNPSTSVVIPPSPNTASLGVYGQIPVSLFTGLPEISMPIGKVSNKDVSVDINLNYHGGGIRPEHHPGWVGLGWDLNAGGVITRKVNITADERCTSGIGGISPYTGYYYNYKIADTSVWASPAVLSNNYYAPDSAGIFTYKEPPAPDEFNFSFGKYSGTFYYNHKGKWQVKSKDPINLKIEEVVKESFSLPHQNVSGRLFNLNIGHIFYQFTITTPDGNKYIFGGTNESVEFTRNAQFNPIMSTYIKHDDGIFSIPSLGPFSDGYNNNVVPTAWYLTKIITRNGEEINFVYERGDIIATQSLVFQDINFKLVHNGTTIYDTPGGIPQGYSYLTNIINPCYLVQIVTPNQTVKFGRSNTNELSYNYQTEYFDPVAKYEDLCNQNGTVLGSDVLDNVHWKKLDSISFYSNKTGLLNKFTFQYKNDPTSRLMLSSVQESGNDGKVKPPYLFLYDTTALPSYNSRKLDHWGFYNNRSYFDSIVKTMYDTTDIPGFIATKTSNFAYGKAGSLVAIKYPTGGTTSFVYESNDYSKVARRFPFTVTDTIGNVLCGGLRIKKIIMQDSVGNLQNIKEYSYVLNYNNGGTQSSGILSGVPRYFVKDFWTSSPGVNEYYYYWYDIPVEPMGFSDGNHVTYTEVVEKLLEGSYTVYNYSNSDQVQYRDTAPVEALAAFGLWYLGPNNSLELERGKLLLKRNYKSGDILLQKTKYEYDETTARNIEPVRIVDIMHQALGGDQQGGGAIVWHRETAYQIYTYPQFLIKKIDSLWDQNGNNPRVVYNQYSYNSLNLLSKVTMTNSKSDTIKTLYQYPLDMVSTNDPTGVYQEMVDKNVISDVIVQKQLKDTTQLSVVQVNYYKPYSYMYARQNIQVQNRYAPIETRIQFYHYDSVGNILEQSKQNDLRQSYIWNYNKSYPVAEIKNASTSDIAYTSFETDGLGNWSLTDVLRNSTYSLTGKKAYDMVSGTNITRSGLTTGKKYIVSYWSRNGAVTVNSTAGTAGPAKNGWTYWEHILPNTTTSVTISGTGKTIDELRLYPYDAQMTTYTYSPLIGMTTQCDANNRITYYEYDNFNRLNLIRDQDRNIIKKICYNYAGQAADCGAIITYYNKADSATYYKYCGGGFSGSPRTYVVDDSVYTSLISQEDANQKARNDIIANGQNYANDNPNGTCPETTITYTNELFKSTKLTLTNNSTGTVYTFTLASRKTTSTVAGTVPNGYYHVVLHTNGSSNYYSVNTYVQAVADTDFDVSNVELTSGDATITIY